MTLNPNRSALASFLRTPTGDRKAIDYERVFDDFISWTGGQRVTDAFEVPPRVMNADYYIHAEAYEILLELKQISSYEAGRTLDNYVASSRERQQTAPDEGVDVDLARPTPAELSTFLRRFRPSIGEHLRKASQQLKTTDHLLPRTNKPRFCGVLLVNSGDYDLPLDLMYHLVEWRTKKMWKRGRFSKLDFVSCLTVDMFRNGQHPLQGRHIARHLRDPLLVDAVRHVYDCWLRYYADAIGMKVEFLPGEGGADERLTLRGHFAGKIRFGPED